MKLCTFEVTTVLGRFDRLGAYTEKGIVDLNFARARIAAERGEGRAQAVADALLPSNMRDFLTAGAPAMERAREAQRWGFDNAAEDDCPAIVHACNAVRLRPPLPNPASVRDFYAFEAHVKRGFQKRGEPMPPEWYEMPVYYRGGHHRILGTDEDVNWPSFTQRFDYELELAAVIGRQGANIPAERAMDYIAGFMVMNDFSARDIQRKEMKVRLGPAKGKDWATALGPVLVTRDEIADPYSLAMVARVNGEEWSRGNSGSIFWRFEQMIEFLTRDDTVYPGDVIGSGTVGTGCGLELDRWVKRGDVLELEIERIGVLRNRVV